MTRTIMVSDPETNKPSVERHLDYDEFTVYVDDSKLSHMHQTKLANRRTVQSPTIRIIVGFNKETRAGVILAYQQSVVYDQAPEGTGHMYAAMSYEAKERQDLKEHEQHELMFLRRLGIKNEILPREMSIEKSELPTAEEQENDQDVFPGLYADPTRRQQAAVRHLMRIAAFNEVSRPYDQLFNLLLVANPISQPPSTQAILDEMRDERKPWGPPTQSAAIVSRTSGFNSDRMAAAPNLASSRVVRRAAAGREMASIQSAGARPSVTHNINTTTPAARTKSALGRRSPPFSKRSSSAFGTITRLGARESTASATSTGAGEEMAERPQSPYARPATAFGIRPGPAVTIRFGPTLTVPRGPRLETETRARERTPLLEDTDDEKNTSKARMSNQKRGARPATKPNPSPSPAWASNIAIRPKTAMGPTERSRIPASVRPNTAVGTRGCPQTAAAVRLTQAPNSALRPPTRLGPREGSKTPATVKFAPERNLSFRPKTPAAARAAPIHTIARLSTDFGPRKGARAPAELGIAQRDSPISAIPSYLRPTAASSRRVAERAVSRGSVTPRPGTTTLRRGQVDSSRPSVPLRPATSVLRRGQMDSSRPSAPPRPATSALRRGNVDFVRMENMPRPTTPYFHHDKTVLGTPSTPYRPIIRRGSRPGEPNSFVNGSPYRAIRGMTVSPVGVRPTYAIRVRRLSDYSGDYDLSNYSGDLDLSDDSEDNDLSDYSEDYDSPSNFSLRFQSGYVAEWVMSGTEAIDASSATSYMTSRNVSFKDASESSRLEISANETSTDSTTITSSEESPKSPALLIGTARKASDIFLTRPYWYRGPVKDDEAEESESESESESEEEKEQEQEEQPALTSTQAQTTPAEPVVAEKKQRKAPPPPLDLTKISKVFFR